METNFNIGSLKIVSAPLMEYFKKIDINLNDNIQLINDKKIPTNFESIDVLKKVSGTLKMLGLTGVNKVLFSVSTALEQVKSAQYDTNKSLAVLEASSSIVKSIVFYLENLLKGEQDQPTKLYDEYSHINKLLGNSVSVKDLFTPKLEFKRNAVSELQYALRLGVVLKAESKEQIVPFLSKNAEDVDASVSKIVSLIDSRSFTSFEEKEVYQNEIKNLYTSSENVQKLNLSKNIYLVSALQKLFISIISPVFNDNFNNIVDAQGDEIKQNLLNVSKTAKDLYVSVDKIAVNDKTGGVKSNEETVCNLLFFILNVLNNVDNAALKNMPIYQEVNSLFDLEFYASQLTNTKVEVSLSQANPEVASQIDKLFVEMKEELSLLTSKQASVDTFFQQHSAKFISNAIKLNELMVNVTTPRLKELTELVSNTISSVKSKQLEFSEVVQKEISLSLVLVEYGINNFVRTLLSPAQKADFELQATLQISRLEAAKSGKLEELNSLARPVLDSGSQKSDERKSMLVIFEKLSKDLKKSEEILNDIFRDPSNTEDLPVVFKTLNSAKGIFAIINKTEFSEILTEVIAVWKRVAESGFDTVSKEELSKSVEFLSGILFYTDATKNDNEVEANELFHRVMAIRNKGKTEDLGATFVLPTQSTVEEAVVVEIEDSQVVETPAVEVLPSFVEEETHELENAFVVESVEVVEPVESVAVEVTNVPESVTLNLVEETVEIVAVVEQSELPQYIDSSDDEELLEVYLMEADEVLAEIVKSLNVLNVNPTDANELSNIRRYFHTLKGSGRMLGLDFLGEAGWMVEQTLNKVISGDLEMSPAMLAELEATRLNFVDWRSTVEREKSVSVDLISMKQRWLAVNRNLMTTIDIPDAVSAPVAEVVEESMVEDFSFDLSVKDETSEFEVEFEETPEEFIAEAEATVLEHEVAEVVETEVTPVEVVEFSFDTPVAEEIEVVAVTVTEEIYVAPVREFININGVDVTESLYSIFREETDSHLRAMNDSIKNQEDSYVGFEVTHEFMRHAHTLGSIAKSVNMDGFAEFVVKIEFIANTCLDRKLMLQGEEFSVLKDSVENLEQFSNIIDGSLESNDTFVSLGERLQGLLNELTSLEEDTSNAGYAPLHYGEVEQEEIKVEISPSFEDSLENKEVNLENNAENNTPVNSFNVQEASDAIVSKVGELLDEKFNEIARENDYAQSFVSKVSPSTSEDVKKVGLDVAKSAETLEGVIEKHFEKVSNVVKHSEEVHVREIEELKSEVQELKRGIEQLQHEQQESFDELKRYMRHLNSAIKKKSNLKNHGLVGIRQEEQELTVTPVAQVETSVDVVVESTSDLVETIVQLMEENSDVPRQASVELFKEEAQVEAVAEEVAEEAQVEAVAEEVTEEAQVEAVAEEVAEEAQVEAVAEEVTEEAQVEAVAEEVTEEAQVEAVAEEVTEEAQVEAVAEEVTEEAQLEAVSEEVTEDAQVEVVAEEVTEEAQVDAVTEEDFSLDFDVEESVEVKTAPVVAPVVTFSTPAHAISAFFANNPFVKTIYEEKVSVIVDELDDELLEIAQMEVDELMESIDDLMESVQSPVLNLEHNKELKRLLHTLKGSVRMAGANKVGAIAHRLESLLDYSESRGISLFAVKDLLEDEMKKISFMLKNVNAPLTSDKVSWIDGEYQDEVVAVEAIKVVTETNEAHVDVEVNPVPVQQVQKKEERQSIRIDANIIDGLINGAGEVRLTRTTLEGMLIGNRRSLSDLRASSDKLMAMLKEIEVQSETQIAAKKELAETDENFDPLEFDRFTRMQELTRFMNEAVADVQDTVTSMEAFLKTQDSAMVQQAVLTNNLLDTLMKVRLIPVDSISDRLYKITRNTAKELGKRVVLELHGEKTEIDRLVLDKVISPVEHLLRNSIAHGIENPEDRTNANKSVAGKVSFNIGVEGNFIMLSIKDDGAGINIDKVRAVAIKKGLLKMGVDYSDKQVVEMIFQSGFSTADTISQVSGRGVGMDVVKKEISELGGSIDIHTVSGQGTEFKIVLPVSVATNHVMLTNVADKLIGIPALNVEEVFSLKRAPIIKAYQDGKVEVKGKSYPMYYLGHMLGLVPPSQLPEFRAYNTLIAINYLGETIVVHIDSLEATTEVLIKSMGSHYSKIAGILGATLLGDGRQGLIVNPVSLRAHYENNIKMSKVQNTEDITEEIQRSGVVTVMVVDDSITVRRATSKVLQRYGYNVVLAKDGEDGLEQLQIVTPDIILSDIEMPRMDGFEFAKNVKNTEKYAGIPIIMITSRTADKHKNFAYSLGVEGFLGKPYQEEELIANITELVQRKKH